MARVLKGSHSFTCTPRVHPLTEFARSSSTHFALTFTTVYNKGNVTRCDIRMKE